MVQTPCDMVQTQAPRESPAFSLGVWPIVLLGPPDQTQNTNAMCIVRLCFAYTACCYALSKLDITEGYCRNISLSNLQPADVETQCNDSELTAV